MLFIYFSTIFLVSFLFYIIFYQYRNYTLPKDYNIITDYIHTDELGPYYVSLSEKLVEYPDRCEKGGILLTDYWTGNLYFAPIKNVHYIMALYERYIKKRDDKDKITMIQVSDALLSHKSEQEDGTYVWPHKQQTFDGQKVPWLHGMAQGLIIAALLRVYELTNNDKYLSASRATLKSFQKSIRKGGVRSDDTKNGVFYEEYAFWEKNRQNHTLNGMMAALFGIYDFWKVTRDESAHLLFEEGVRTIRKNLMRYDFPFCSSYDLRHEKGEKHIFNTRYNAVHVAHLTILSVMTGDKYFEGVAKCWDKKLRDRINRLRVVFYYLKWKFYDIVENIKWRGVKIVFMVNLKRLWLRF